MPEGVVQGDNTFRDDMFCDFSRPICGTVSSVKFRMTVSGNSAPDLFFEFKVAGVLTPITFITNNGAQSPSVGVISSAGGAQTSVDFRGRDSDHRFTKLMYFNGI